MGRMRTAPKSGKFSGKVLAAAASPARAPPGAEPAPPAPADAAAPPEPDINRKAASTSRVVAYFRGNTPTDMPLSKSTSKVETMSNQPSACVRLPARINRFRTLSTRHKASGGNMGLRMAAISAAPMYCSGTMIAPLPGGNGLPGNAWREAATMPFNASGRPTW